MVEVAGRDSYNDVGSWLFSPYSPSLILRTRGEYVCDVTTGSVAYETLTVV